METTTVEIRTNIEPFLKKIYEFSDKVGNKLSEKALREGGKYLKKEVQGRTPKDTGRLKKAIKLAKSKRETAKKTGNVGLYVGVRRGKTRDDIKGAYYARFVESGTQFQSGQHFFENTFANAKERATQIVITALEQGSQQLANAIP